MYTLIVLKADYIFFVRSFTRAEKRSYPWSGDSGSESGSIPDSSPGQEKRKRISDEDLKDVKNPLPQVHVHIQNYTNL